MIYKRLKRDTQNKNIGLKSSLSIPVLNTRFFSSIHVFGGFNGEFLNDVFEISIGGTSHLFCLLYCVFTVKINKKTGY